jgi:hypothetical protein
MGKKVVELTGDTTPDAQAIKVRVDLIPARFLSESCTLVAVRFVTAAALPFVCLEITCAESTGLVKLFDGLTARCSSCAGRRHPDHDAREVGRYQSVVEDARLRQAGAAFIRRAFSCALGCIVLSRRLVGLLPAV